jgi:hypothetical protein
MKNCVDSHRIQWLAICEHNKYELVFLDLAFANGTNYLHRLSANDENMNCERKRSGPYLKTRQRRMNLPSPSNAPILCGAEKFNSPRRSSCHATPIRLNLNYSKYLNIIERHLSTKDA